MFHDVGKSLHPEFLCGKSAGGPKPSRQPHPEISAQVIIEHVPNGLKMAAKTSFGGRHSQLYRRTSRHKPDLLPNINAHPGRRCDELWSIKSQFRYPGPKPQTRETALLMLADGCEAKARADRARNEEEIEKIVRYIFDRTLSANQLDECDLTLHDLELIHVSFVETLKSFFHSRITYPEEKLSLVTERRSRYAALSGAKRALATSTRYANYKKASLQACPQSAQVHAPARRSALCTVSRFRSTRTSRAVSSRNFCARPQKPPSTINRPAPAHSPFLSAVMRLSKISTDSFWATTIPPMYYPSLQEADDPDAAGRYFVILPSPIHAPPLSTGRRSCP